jgi:hypothetical protein
VISTVDGGETFDNGVFSGLFAKIDSIVIWADIGSKIRFAENHRVHLRGTLDFANIFPNQNILGFLFNERIHGLLERTALPPSSEDYLRKKIDQDLHAYEKSDQFRFQAWNDRLKY